MLIIFVLKFTTPRYTLLFLYSEIYIVHVINCEWSRSVIFPLRICIFPSNGIRVVFNFELYNMFCKFWIRNYSFMLLEDYAFNFLHGCWNYDLIKTNTGVMMLFKFEFKYVKLIFKAIASMKFNFDIILWLSCSYVSCLFKKNHRKLP